MDNQFYPTPPALAERAYKRFENRDITRLLEPSAGRADLIEPVLKSYRWSVPAIDCIEIDLDNQAVLRSKKLRVIDSDFLKFEGKGSYYSHILMNPSFRNGVDHVLKAWEILYDGEIVAILNASTIEHTDSKKKILLASIIKAHGSVEYIDESFLDPDTKRKTPVRVALVHLKKVADLKLDYFSELKVDTTEHTEDYISPQMLALPNSSIENTVKAFTVAVEKMKTSIIAKEEANYYAGLIGLDFASNDKKEHKPDTRNVQQKINDKYIELKKAAWRQVLKATDFSDHLSSKAQKRLEADFEQVSNLEFTLSNIYGLLHGLMEQKGTMQNDMCADVFDNICSRFGTEGNRAYFMGWKSNDKHKKNGFRIKMTRFVLPSFSKSLTFESRNTLEDIDKVFALMEGIPKPEFSLADTFNENTTKLRNGGRVSSTYFDIRWYPGRGTMHFFPKNKVLVDRLNRTVGRLRQWLPDESTKNDERFWEQYEKAESVTKVMERIVKNKNARSYGRSFNEECELYEQASDIHAEACDELGIVLPSLSYDQQEELPLFEVA
jgi:hypothetical protein